MPELPEVETTRRGIAPSILNQPISEVLIRQYSLRWPITESLTSDLPGKRFLNVDRRGKYLLLRTESGVLIIHLGMSGSLRLVSADVKPAKHDHVDIVFSSDMVLRYTDPRRFGCILWVTEPIESHPLLCKLGPEPLSENFYAGYLKARSKGKSVAVKNFIMDSHVVVGVGNIYANEALFYAGIRPGIRAGGISLARYQQLVEQIKIVLNRAIKVGGTTLRDFSGSDGKPGYFTQSLQVYGRGGQACLVCDEILKEIRLGQRSTVYCPACQK
jgi:formamidopyrimidine-DNA glycosylase